MAMGTAQAVRHVEVRVRFPISVAVVALAATMAGCGIGRAPGSSGMPGFPGQTPPPPGGASHGCRPCGVAGAASQSPVPAPPAGIPPASPALVMTGPATLTAADNGVTVRLSRGQMVAVVLSPQLLSWYPPAATGPAVRRTSASGGYPDQTSARAIFLAVRPGTATLDATDDIRCLHMQPSCTLPQQQWRVTVIVG
jgi:hypothetical protein